MFLMWAVMMVGMMLPSAAPMILLYDRVRERQEARGASLAATGVFALGYLVAWSAVQPRRDLPRSGRSSRRRC